MRTGRILAVMGRSWRFLPAPRIAARADGSSTRLPRVRRSNMLAGMTDAPTSDAPTLEFVFEARVRVAAPLLLGEAGGTARRIVPILGGEVSGPRLTGHVLPGGTDWQVVEPDGLVALTARYTIEAADGTLIAVENQGL